MSNKRLLILVAADSAEDNGLTVRGKAVLSALKGGYHVLLPPSRSWYSANALVLLGGYLAWMLKLLYIIPRQHVDCVYCCADYFGFISAYVLSKLFGFRIVFEAHGILSEENKAKQRSAILVSACSSLERFVIGRADYVVALSHHIVDAYYKFNTNIVLIPAFVDDTAYRRGRRIPGNRKTIGLIGPFDMPANKYSLRFLRDHIGEFDQRIRFKVIGKCDEVIASDRIRYTGYIRSRNDYINELSSLDALIVPSTLPTFGPLNKVLEGMASGLPVYTSPQGVIGLDCVENGANIIIEDTNRLATVINQTIFNDAFMEGVGHNARDLIEQKYSEKANRIKLRCVIDRVMNGNVKHSQLLAVHRHPGEPKT